MGGKQGVIRVNISVPRELKDQMEAVNSVNWSGVAAEAFRKKLRELESRKDAKTMDDVVARLKAAAELEGKEDYQAGFAAGERWAKKEATPKQLRRLAEYIDRFATERLDWFDVDYPGWDAPWGATGFFALAVLGSNKDVADRGEDECFWKRALGDNADRAQDPDFFRGFGEGAASVWEKVQGEF